MKKLIAFVTMLISLLVFTFTACAEHDVNLMSDYHSLLWEGDTLYYNKDHGTVCFGNEKETAFISFPTEDASGFWFYADIGNQYNKGSGYVDVTFLDSDNNKIKSFVTDKIGGNGSFNRYQLGSSKEYVKVPENAEKVRITLGFENGEQSPYFRNLSLILSNSRTINADISDWTVSGKLQIVQVGVTKKDHIIWIIFVAAVALIMFAVRKSMDKAKKIK